MDRNNKFKKFNRRPAQFRQTTSFGIGKAGRKILSPEIDIEPDFLVTDKDENIVTDKNKNIILSKD